MSIHIEAKKGEIAEVVLMPGDPLRAKYIADHFLEDVHCYNRVRGMFGFTGFYKGRRISVQGSGMGMPSLSIYVNELLNEYDVKEIIRVGTCGAFQPEIKVRDIVLAMASCSNSAMNTRRFRGMDFAPCANFELLHRAYLNCNDMGIDVHVGNVFAADDFYGDDPEEWKIWAEYGVLAVDMESAALYTLAARAKAKALTLLTVSDSFITNEVMSAEEREKSVSTMVEIALGSM